MTASNHQAPDRNLAMELVRVTESAALAAGRWVGRGDKNGGDGAAVDAMRQLLSTVSMRGVVVIGEGEKDEAPMLYNGEEVGNGEGPPDCDVAVDPIDGTTLMAEGRPPNSISVIAVSERGTMYDPSAVFYMDKIAVGPDAKGAININESVEWNINSVAKAKGIDVADLTVIVLDRPPRHADLIGEIRQAGAKIRLISDGDVAGAVAAADDYSTVDMLMGVGGTPRGHHHGRRDEVHGRRDPGQAVAPPQRRGAPEGHRRGSRPRPGPDQRHPGERREQLLLRDRCHQRRHAARRHLPSQRCDHSFAGHAIEVGHRPPHRAVHKPAKLREYARISL